MDEAIQKVRDFFSSEKSGDLSVVFGALEGVQELREKHELLVVTSRFWFLQDLTRKWVAKHFPNCFSEVHFGHNAYTNEGRTLSKAEQCAKLGVNVLVDDLLEHAEVCAALGIRVLLFDALWNQGDLPEGVERVRDGGEIVERLS